MTSRISDRIRPAIRSISKTIKVVASFISYCCCRRRFRGNLGRMNASLDSVFDDLVVSVIADASKRGDLGDAVLVRKISTVVVPHKLTVITLCCCGRCCRCCGGRCRACSCCWLRRYVQISSTSISTRTAVIET